MGSMFSPARLERVGIELVDENKIWFRCKVDGKVWSPDIQTGGKLKRGWWRCPNGCNSHIKNIDRPEE